MRIRIRTANAADANSLIKALRMHAAFNWKYRTSSSVVWAVSECACCVAWSWLPFIINMERNWISFLMSVCAPSMAIDYTHWVRNLLLLPSPPSPLLVPRLTRQQRHTHSPNMFVYMSVSQSVHVAHFSLVGMPATNSPYIRVGIEVRACDST